VLEKIAAGADVVNAARSMMLALGCIQSLSCNTNHCPTGVATTDPKRAKAINVEEKALRVYNFHKATVNAFMELCGAMGYDDPGKLKPSDIIIRQDASYRNFAEINITVGPGQLLDGSAPQQYLSDWINASADSF
jgi:glutamate synthase domain-containing protein 2